jgi:Fe-S-cluster-containing dehydrogenase component
MLETLKKDSKTASNRFFVAVDPSKCVGCNVCEYICALEKEGSFNPLRSRIRIAHLHPLVNVVAVCRFCEDAPCVRACLRNALKQSRENGVILIGEEKCDACGWCIQACPYGAMMFNPEKRVVMACDLCGGEPKCIDFCPEEALSLVAENIDSQKMWLSSIEKVFQEASRLMESIKSRTLENIFAEADKRAKRLEEKLEALSKRELELPVASQ